jgi:hypothetical protein
VRKLFDRVGDDARVLEAREALRARPDMGLEGGNAETLLVIEEEVDFGRKKVAMIHERSTRRGGDGFQRNGREFFERETRTKWQ